MRFARSFFFATVVCMLLPVHAARDDCTAGSLHDILATAQEMILLIAAFTIGWHLIGPFLGVAFRQSRAAALCNAIRGSPRPGSLADRPRDSGAAGDSPSGPGLTQQAQAFSFPPGRPDVAVDLWISMAEKTEAEGLGSLPEPAFYAKAFEACIELGDFDSAHRLARRAAWSVPAGSSGSSKLLALARWLARRQKIDEAMECIKQVRRTGNAVDLRSMKPLIVVCAQLGQVDLGRALFEELACDKIKPDFVTYSAMIRGLCNVGKVEEALAYVEKMRRDTIYLDAMLFDVLLEACVHQNFFKGAEHLLAQMKELGMQPSSATLATCIRLYSSRGELQRAMSIFDDMSREYHLQPNAYVYGALVAACVRCGKPDLAMSTHERMAAAGCMPSARTYELLIQCCIQLGWTAKAVELLDAALGLRTESEDAVPRTPAFVDPKVVEDLLLLLARRKQASSLGVPLLKRLEEADFELPERVAGIAAVEPTWESQRSPARHVRCERRRDFDQWRNFAGA